MPTELMRLGKIARPHGVRGDLVIDPQNPHLMPLIETAKLVYLGEPPVEYTVEAARLHRGRWLLRIAGCEDRNAAEAYRGLAVQIPLVALKPLSPGTYYPHQLLGLAVFTETGESLGQLSEIIETGANDVYVVHPSTGKDLLLPAIKDVVLSVDLEAQRMTVHLLEGLR